MACYGRGVRVAVTVGVGVTVTILVKRCGTHPTRPSLSITSIQIKPLTASTPYKTTRGSPSRMVPIIGPSGYARSRNPSPSVFATRATDGVGVLVAVLVGVGVWVLVGVWVAVAVAVLVGVAVRVGVGEGPMVGVGV